MYGSAKATKPKNIGVKHIKDYNPSLRISRVKDYLLDGESMNTIMAELYPQNSIMDKLHNQKATEVKEDLK